MCLIIDDQNSGDVMPKEKKEKKDLTVRKEEKEETGALAPSEWFRDPFSEMRELLNSFRFDMEDVFGRVFPSSVALPQERAVLPVLKQPNLDVLDAGTEYQVHVDLPGLKKEDIAIELTPDSIEISAESTMEKEESKEGEYLFRERGYSAFKRIVPFPAEIIPDKAEAKFEDGVLEVVLPKKEPTPASKKVKLELK